MATRQQLETALQNAHSAGDEQAARRLAQAINAGEFEQERGAFRRFVADPALESMAAVNRGATMAADFLTTSPINAALELSGSDRRIPSITGAASPATAGNFMDEGIGRDAIRTAGEVVAPGVAAGQMFRSGAQALPQLGRQAESVRAGALRQMGQSTPGQDAALSAVAGAGASVGGRAGESVGGEAGRQVGETVGGFLAPVGGAIAQRSVQNVTTRTARNLLREAAPSVDGLKDASREIYRQIDDLGARVSSDSFDSFANNLRTTMQREGINRRLHPGVSAAVREFDQAVGSNQPLQRIDTLRQVASDAAMSQSPSEQRLGRMMVRQIDGFMENLGPDDFIGGQRANVGPMYRDARQLWQRARKGEQVAEAIERGSLAASGPETGIRNEFRSILRNKRSRQGFTAEELSAMREVTNADTMANLVRGLGKFGISEGQASRVLVPMLGAIGGASAAGPVGGLAVPAIGQVARGSARRRTERAADFVSALSRAGQDGQSVARAYIRNTPRGERNAEDLARLLMERGAMTGQMRVDRGDTPTRRIISDAAYIVNTLRAAQEEEEDSE